MTHADQHAPLSWQASAECTQSDPDAWFPSNGAVDHRAKAICDQVCTVREQCLQYALANGEEWGTWAGMNGAELKRLRNEIEEGGRT